MLWKPSATLLAGYLFWTGVTGSEIFWGAWPTVEERMTADTGRWLVVAFAALIVLLAVGPSALSTISRLIGWKPESGEPPKPRSIPLDAYPGTKPTEPTKAASTPISMTLMTPLAALERWMEKEAIPEERRGYLRERTERYLEEESHLSESDVVNRLVEKLRDGHVLDARLLNTKRRDEAWYPLCDEIDEWTFSVQQLLFNGPTELLTHFDGDWQPNALQSRYEISAELQARLRELSEIVQKLKHR